LVDVISVLEGDTVTVFDAVLLQPFDVAVTVYAVEIVGVTVIEELVEAFDQR
jgi:hypothetical protein